MGQENHRVEGARGLGALLARAVWVRGTGYWLRGPPLCPGAPPAQVPAAWWPVFLLAGGAAMSGGLLLRAGWPVLGAGVTLLAAAALVGAALVAGAVASTRPPPTRPSCQRGVPGDGEAPSPFFPYDAPTDLLPLAPGLHVAQAPLLFHGARFGARMAVVELETEADGRPSLLVHSPTPLTDTIRARVMELGHVRHVVAPNVLHHLYVRPWLEAFPEASLHLAPGLRERGLGLPEGEVIATADHAVPWSRDRLDVAVLLGHPFHKEVLLFHRPSGTLLACDAIENLGHAPESGLVVRLLLALAGMAGRPGPPVDLKLTVADRAALAASLAPTDGWPIERIVLAHGRLVDREAKQTWRDAWAFVRG